MVMFIERLTLTEAVGKWLDELELLLEAISSPVKAIDTVKISLQPL